MLFTQRAVKLGRMRSSLLVCLSAFALSACAASPSSEPSTSSMPAMVSSYSEPSAPAAPRRDASLADLVVRPDLVCVPFVLRAEHLDPKEAVKLLEGTVHAVGERFSAVTQGGAVLKMLGASSVLVAYEKDGDEEKPRYAVTVDGSIDVRLPANADYWARARLVAALSEASLSAKPKARAGKGRADEAPVMDASFEAPQLKVADPEAYRPELLKRWTERTRAFARGAESNVAPLDLVDCAPPGGITQMPLSLEQVGLSLAVTCHLDVVRKAQ
jgi:hypothetical protein